VASDGGNSYVKAQTNPVCATLGATTALLGGTVKYCGASGTLGLDLQLDMESEFLAAAPAQAMADASLDVLDQDAIVIVTPVGDDRYRTRITLNE
jgi:hypothetical protein